MEDVTRMPLLGEPFPEVKVQTTHGPMTLPNDYKGKWFVLFSHPADFTPVCTTEFVAFAQKADEFKKMGVELIGLSVDQVFSHIKWVEWIKDNLNVEIPFPVVADSAEGVSKKLGMIQPAKSASNTVRAVFVVDPKGAMRLMVYYPQEIGRNVDEIIRAVKALMVSDENGVATPENWPNNALIGEDVIIPPATCVEEADKRKGQEGCFDWWFCHKPLK
ncbi:MAG TPA: peroxiredoxin [Flavobacteriales bacterium]|nr:peroxiredoxin [Flavobacteriales bacterium]